MTSETEKGTQKQAHKYRSIIQLRVIVKITKGRRKAI